MWKKLLVVCGLVALVGAVVLSAVLGTAGVGKAASPNICLTASTSTTNASCVAELTAPHVLTAGEDAVSVTRFTNQSNLGGASATHVVLSATFLVGTVATQVTVKGITLFVNGSPVSTTSCSPSPALLPTLVATVSCPAGTIAGGSSAKLVVRFSASTARTVAGNASYGEGGNDSSPPRPNGAKNDTQTSRDSFTIAGTSAFGDCFDTTTATVSGSTTTQLTRAELGAVDSSLDLPCTPAGAGVDTVGPRPAGFVDIWFTDFLAIDNGGFGIVTLDALFNVPKGFVLRELTGPDPSDAESWTPVPACVSGLPPSGDSCIFDTSNLPKGGVRWILHAFGTLFDSKYAG